METLQPKLRFPEFSGDWDEKKLGDIGEIVNGLTYSPDDINDNGVLVLRSSNVQERRIVYTDNVFVNAKSYNEVLENDILICVRNGSKSLIGKNALIDKKSEGLAFGAFMTVYRSKYNNYLFHWFDSSDYKKIVDTNLGATINSINNNDLKKFVVPFPSIKEQAKIATFLTEIDTKINQLNQKKKLLEQYKKGVMQKIFNQEIRFKDDNGNDFADWEDTTLENICEFENGKAHENDIDINGEFVVVNSKFISTNGIVRKYINSIICKLEKNDIAMVMSDVPNGKAIAKCFYVDENNKYSLNQRICKIRIKEANSKFIFYLIDRNPYYLAFDSGVGQTNLRKNEVLECPLYIPIDVNEQSKIANFITAIDDNINKVSNQLEQSKAYKKGLLQQMFV